MELTKIKGVNEKREAEFNKLGVYNTKDLLKFFPRTYLDLREKQLLKYAFSNDFVLTTGKVISIPVNRFATKKTGLVKIICEQEGFIFPVVWFNQPYVLSKIVVGEEYLFYGRVNDRNGEIGLVNPTFENCEKNFRLKGIVPQYACKNNLSQKIVRDCARLSVDIEKPKSIIPFDLQEKYQLSNLYYAYKQVHNPDNFEVLESSSDRIAVEEYFALISAFKFIKGDRNNIRQNKYSVSSKELVEFISKRFPFEFTDGQKNAVNEIYTDMHSSCTMNRLMQGDVGSGKTAVSMCAIFLAVKSGYQVCFLAPTEVLARQNFIAVKNAFPEYNVSLLTGSLSAKEKRSVKQDVKSGLTQILVGTHALIEDDVEFKNLSLCVCDEQQRFGVAQRSALLNKGVTPDVLVMSATPIPRTLSLIIYGDLDITTIKDKPKMRIPIQTNIVPKEKYLDMLGFIKNEINSGKKAYFVCPKIEGDEEGTIMSVTDLYNDLSSRLSGINIGLLHGKLKENEKNQIMSNFKLGDIQLLVSTTVIEVGVDVPEASVMVIYNAERFGLSQLHQLRGRVGRSDIKSYCFLLTSAIGGPSLDRLKIIKDNGDGFKIAEYDYKMRGGGDFMGSRQSGKTISDLGYLNYNTESIYLAKKISDEYFEGGYDVSLIKDVAIEKYNKLKDITLN